ncbi:uncharacterized protein F4807DRAFT_450786 [Annulohypoxylon truncatum]|uniref:uncharacterized protein n=1 Tax=Annulohypoxylon truncatum TaxID=327061 RepID=UPI002007FE96|nr:uncharacterized protein F4807DRAFT_450786 [Annulohypoxylon truncatum]KAI1211597.1 hypothetical protein F4807DRAFT_450786 [Annulohypoxylon truncatum]
MDRIVFRLRQLPSHIDKLATVMLLSKALGIKASAIWIFSLASSVDPWLQHKVATLMFDGDSGIQQVLEGRRPGVTKQGDEWVIEADNLGDNWILDSHFRGLTALYDPPSHAADCIAISGLASHPFGSWQPKGQSKSFMWIRDALPKSLPNVRPILYGYDSTLVKSHSFQSTFDLALALINQLKANGWVSPTCKPLAFLAHSLGGIILKQALVSLAGMNERDSPILRVMKGAVFFGVPNLGMEQSHLEAVVVGQANTELIQTLSPKSPYLFQLDKQFTGISEIQNCLLYWCYETTKSSTVTLDSDGKWSRMGPEEILVTPESATRGLYGDPTKQDSIFPIDKDHSSIVKFSENDPNYSVVVRQLNQVLFSRDSTRGREELEPANLAINITQRPLDPAAVAQGTSSKDDILMSLHDPEVDRRLLEIEDKFQDTLNWVYDLPEPGFNRWLQNYTGLFWIRGIPGSDQRTSDLLSDWTGEKSYIRAAFFFHHRGTLLQKSFEGLLRSIISQIILQKPALCRFIHDKKDLSSGHWTLKMLQKSFNDILRQEEVPFHLCLFFDALDEYDGPLEFLCRFLKDLGAITPTPNRQIKVCFSSRPWDIFLSTFRGCAGFNIHDFTQDDITNYCLGSIKAENLSSVALESFIPDIVTRSKGVFLWVKLFINELAQTNGAITNDIEMKSLLESYPTELDSFYTEVIQRIPRAYRRMTYTMLETTVRCMDKLTPLRLLGIIDCSGCKTYSDALEMLWKPYKLKKEYLTALIQRNSKKYCGGLIEVYDDGFGPYIQVLHQTVEDFVKDPKFKQIVLQEQSRITVENGYTFCAKYSMLRATVDDFDDGRRQRLDPHDYAYLSERTTGHSLKAFVDSIPREKINLVTRSPEKDTPLALAANFDCRLHIIDLLSDSPTLLQESREPLLSYCLPISMFLSRKESPSTVKLLLERGFTPDKDPEAFDKLIWRLAHGASPNYYTDLVEILLKYGQSPDMKFHDDSGLEPAALHFSRLPPMAIKVLLDNGATVNILDIRGRTPLDCLCEEAYDDGDLKFGMPVPEAYETACLLVSRGGIVTKGALKYSKWLLRKIEDAGLPTEDLKDCLSRPGKGPKLPLKSKFKKMGFYISKAMTSSND